MKFRSLSLLLPFCACLGASAVFAKADCTRPALTHQRRDAVSIQALETAWTQAYLTGDTDFEKCILTPDFTEIMRNGSIHHLSDELELAAKNRGKPVTSADTPQITIHVHGIVAVAYGISSAQTIDGKVRKSYFADYYIWNKGSWRVYFAQQTSFVVTG
jgi:hypothetical protein